MTKMTFYEISLGLQGKKGPLPQEIELVSAWNGPYNDHGKTAIWVNTSLFPNEEINLGDRTLIVTQDMFSAHRLTVGKIICKPGGWFFGKTKKKSRLDLVNCKVGEVITEGVEDIFMQNVRSLTKPEFRHAGTLRLWDNSDMRGIVTTGTKNLQRLDIVGCDGLVLSDEQETVALRNQGPWQDYPDYPAFFGVLGLRNVRREYKLG